MDIDNKHSHDDREGHKNHDEEQILTNQRDDFGRRRDYFLNH